MERENFLEVYSDITKWLTDKGFRLGHYWNESSTPMDYHYSHYEEHINALFGVEHYVHDILGFDIRFMRDWNEHKFMFIGELGKYSDTYKPEKFKEKIIFLLKDMKNQKIRELSKIEI